MLLVDGYGKLGQFSASRGSDTPAYDALKGARERADQALEIDAGNISATKLREGVAAELKLLSDSGTAKLQAFRDSTARHVPGYPMLVSAKDLSDHIADVDPKYPPGIALAAEVASETAALDEVVRAANAQITSKDFDSAYITIGKYVSFAGEEPRLQQVVAAVYKYHLDKGNAEAAANDWTGAVADFKRANEIAPTDEAAGSIVKAQAGLVTAQNREAADKALAISKERVGANDPIGAYEVLANLNDAQRVLVKDDLAGMQDSYVQAAIAEAAQLQLAHTPIQGRADEDAMRKAYDYLLHASKLSNNPEIELKLRLMADAIANYYVGVASKYLSKPLSSGVGLGWGFLNEAAQYRPDLDVIRDARTSNLAAYQMRSRLTIGVVFRDQTSRRDQGDFKAQLEEAFATGLDTSGLPVKVVPKGSSTLDPNFEFVGDIKEHRTSIIPQKETLQSKYRSGTQENPNPAWNEADQAYEAALVDLQKAQGELTAAQAKNNKKAIDTAQSDVSTEEAIVLQARSKMNAIPPKLTEWVITPYNYTRTTLEVTTKVELSFRVLDSSGNLIGEPFDVVKGEEPKKFIILDQIKADDTQGIKEIDTMPDENQLMTDVEIDARDTIVKAARDKVQELPKKILAQARDKAANNDLDGAGESYILYLNCTPAGSSPERLEAIRFLSDKFNIRNTGDLRAITP
jgi:hypothetical protein